MTVTKEFLNILERELAYALLKITLLPPFAVYFCCYCCTTSGCYGEEQGYAIGTFVSNIKSSSRARSDSSLTFDHILFQIS